MADDNSFSLDLCDFTSGSLSLGLCSSCYQKDKEIENLRNEQAAVQMNFKVLKQKIIATDQLLRQYKAKTAECISQEKQIEEWVRKYEKSQRFKTVGIFDGKGYLKKEVTVLEAQLMKTLEEMEPVRRSKAELEQQIKKLEKEKGDLEIKLNTAEFLNNQYEMRIASMEAAKNSTEGVSAESKKKLTHLENKLKQHGNRINKLLAENKVLRVEAAKNRRKEKRLQCHLKRTEVKLSKHLDILVENGLLTEKAKAKVMASVIRLDRNVDSDLSSDFDYKSGSDFETENDEKELEEKGEETDSKDTPSAPVSRSKLTSTCPVKNTIKGNGTVVSVSKNILSLSKSGLIFRPQELKTVGQMSPRKKRRKNTGKAIEDMITKMEEMMRPLPFAHSPLPLSPSPSPPSPSPPPSVATVVVEVPVSSPVLTSQGSPVDCSSENGADCWTEQVQSVPITCVETDQILSVKPSEQSQVTSAGYLEKTESSQSPDIYLSEPYLSVQNVSSNCLEPSERDCTLAVCPEPNHIVSANAMCETTLAVCPEPNQIVSVLCQESAETAFDVCLEPNKIVTSVYQESTETVLDVCLEPNKIVTSVCQKPNHTVSAVCQEPNQIETVLCQKPNHTQQCHTVSPPWSKPERPCDSVSASHPQLGYTASPPCPEPNNTLSTLYPQPYHAVSPPRSELDHTLSAPCPEPDHTLSAPCPEPDHTLSAPCPEPDHTLSTPSPEPDHTLSAPCPEPDHTLSASCPEPDYTPSAPCPEPARTLSSPSPEPDHTLSAPCPEPDHTLSAPCPEPDHALSAPCPEPDHTLSAPCPESAHTLSAPCPEPDHILSAPCPEPDHILSASCPEPDHILSAPCTEPDHTLSAPCPEPAHTLSVPCPEPDHTHSPPCPEPDHTPSAPCPEPDHTLSVPYPDPDHPLSAPCPEPDHPLSAPCPEPDHPLSAPCPEPDHTLSASRPEPDHTLSASHHQPDHTASSPCSVPDQKACLVSSDADHTMSKACFEPVHLPDLNHTCPRNVSSLTQYAEVLTICDLFSCSFSLLSPLPPCPVKCKKHFPHAKAVDRVALCNGKLRAKVKMTASQQAHGSTLPNPVDQAKAADNVALCNGKLRAGVKLTASQQSNGSRLSNPVEQAKKEMKLRHEASVETDSSHVTNSAASISQKFIKNKATAGVSGACLLNGQGHGLVASVTGKKKRKAKEDLSAPSQAKKATPAGIQNSPIDTVQQRVREVIAKYCSVSSYSLESVIASLQKIGPLLTCWLPVIHAVIMLLKTEDIDLQPDIIKACTSTGTGIAFRKKHQAFMDVTEIRFMHLLARLMEIESGCERIQLMQTLWTAIFVASDFEKASITQRASICRLFVGLCGMAGRVDEVRVLAFHIVLVGVSNFISLILTVAAAWPKALTHTGTTESTGVLIVLEHVVMTSIASNTGMSKLGTCLEQLCDWTPSSQDSLHILLQHVSALQMATTGVESNDDRIYELSCCIELLCTANDLPWMVKNFLDRAVQSAMTRWAMKGEEGISPRYVIAICRLVGKVMLPGIKKKSKVLTRLFNIHCRNLLISKHSHPAVEEACVDMLLQLAPLKPPTVFGIIHEWYRHRYGSIPSQLKDRIIALRNLIKSRATNMVLDEFS